MDKSRPTLNDLPKLPLESILTERSVLAVGNDIVEVPRIRSLLAQSSERFMKRCFTSGEIRDCQGKAHPAVHFAGRWAAKEAVFKALKLQWDRAFSWKEIEICGGPDHSPGVLLSREIRSGYPENQVPDILLSISHCDEYAFAIALAVGRGTSQSRVKR
ncbi:holo-ACP synthase [Marispirochaeta sp.]|jgi:holo-[acyl-carrier protein] synthase|uniref:holo-ACP synthase n=1 Tax=Marispirochaeta sp. TaxID=2038653 RepID=UPI0029C71617|nr:holo-ACP synthase [Marispirochaeta sp.]